MRIVVDTSAWSFFLRRDRSNLSPAQRRLRLLLREMIADGRAVIPGIVRQELLSGIRDARAFDRIREYLRYFDDDAPEISDYEQAARFHNRCRGAGIAASAIDMLLCALAERRGLPILTLDDDFRLYASELPVQLHALP